MWNAIDIVGATVEPTRWLHARVKEDPVMTTCRCCRTRAADSKEHVFTSAIGGRLKVQGVTCRTCNNECGRTIDESLSRSFALFCLMLAIKGDRGQVGSLVVTDAEGRKIILDPGLLPRDGGPPVVAVDGNKIQIRAGSPKQVREVLASLERKEGKTVNIDSVMHGYEFAANVKLKVEFESDRFLRSAVKTAVVFAEARAPELTGILGPAWDFVVGKDPPADLFDVQFTAKECPWAPPELGPVAHRVLLDADAESGRVLFDVRFFGEFAVRGYVTGPVPAKRRQAYGIDPISRRPLAATTWNGSIELGTSTREEIDAHTAQAVEQVRRRARDVELEQLSAKILRDARQAIDPNEDPLAFSQRVAEEVAIHLRRQNVERPEPVREERLLPKPRPK